MLSNIIYLEAILSAYEPEELYTAVANPTWAFSTSKTV